MKKLLLILLIVPVISFGQKRQKFDFPRNEQGKIEYDSRLYSFDRNFKMTVKTDLATYADYFNGAVTFGNARMHDYVSYEDDSTIVASVKFYVKQAFRLNVFSSEVEFDKEGTNQYIFKMKKFRLLQVFNNWGQYSNQQNVVLDMDNFNVGTHQALCGHLDQEIMHFATFFNN